MDQKPKYPKVAAARHPTTGEPILVSAYEKGYAPAPLINPERFNHLRGITAGMAEAMLAGSMFGWDCPGADPTHYTSDGQPIS